MVGMRAKKGSAVSAVLKRIQRSPGTMIRAADFPEFSQVNVSQAFSRLTRKGVLQRVSKGVYYAPKPTLLGPSQPSQLAVDLDVIADQARPTRGTAAAMLGLTTQVPARPEFIVMGSGPPSNIGAALLHVREVITHTTLTFQEAAWLEAVRDRASFSELDAPQTLEIMLEHLRRFATSSSDSTKLALTRRLRRLLRATLLEPPRSRAIVGAMLEHLGMSAKIWMPLKESLNPQSKYDFGPFGWLPNAEDWQCR